MFILMHCIIIICIYIIETDSFQQQNILLYLFSIISSVFIKFYNYIRKTDIYENIF
jgi:hypothetical protein